MPGAPKITDDQATAIRAAWATRKPHLTDLAAQYGIGIRTVQRILSNTIHRDPSYTPPPPRRRGPKPTSRPPGLPALTRNQVAAIRSTYATGNVSQRSLAATYDISQAQISKILSNRAWHDPDYTPKGTR